MADRFWVGGTGNWSDATNHWATVSGGAPGAGNTPTAADRAIFDAASNTTGYTVTVDATVNCLDLLFSAAPSVSGTINLAGSSAINIARNFTMLGSMTHTYNSGFTMNGGAGVAGVITSNGKAWGGVGPNFTINANATASYQLADAFSVAGNTFNLTAGTVDLNGKVLGCGNCSLSGAGVRTINFNAGTVNCTNWNLTTTTNLTFNMGTGTINSGNGGQFDGGGLTYNVVTITAAQSHRLTGANTFGTLTLTTTAVKTAFTPLGANQVVTGTLTISGNSITNRAFITSDTVGTPRTITAAVVVITNTDFQDIIGAGAATWSGTSVGNGLGNSGITFTPSATQFAKSGASFNWSDATKWFLATNGGGGAGRVPLPQDDVVFDSSSITAGSVTITMDMPRAGRSIDFSGITNAPTLTTAASLTVNAFGNWAMGTGMGNWSTGSSAFLQMSARSPVTFGCAGKANSMILVINAFGGSVTLADAYQSARIQMVNGTLDANGFNVTAVYMLATSAVAKTINLGTGLWSMTGNDSSGSSPWNIGGGTTVNPSTSTIKLTDTSAVAKTFGGGGKTYNNVWFAGTGAAHQMTASNAFNQLKVDSGQTLNFTAATTTTAADWQLSGATIGSITAAGHTLAMSGAGKVQAVGATISRSTATPANTFYAVNSTNGGNNSGWVFGAYLALDAMAPVLAAFPGWSVRKSWRVAIDTLPVVAAFSDWLVRDVRPDPDYVVSADSRARSIRGSRDDRAIAGSRTRSISR